MAQYDSRLTSDAKENATRIEDEIEALRSRLRERKVNYREFWDQVKQLNSLFRSLKPLLPEDRQRLWNMVGRVCTEAKEHQAEAKRDRESRENVSRNKRSLVESKIREAFYQAKGGSTPSELGKARELLREALEWMKNGWSGFNAPTQLFAFDDGKMTKADHDACWEKWQEANEMLLARRHEISEYNFDRFKGEAEDAIGIAAYDPKHAKEKVKVIQESMRGKIMSGEQFAEVRRLLDKAWGRAGDKQSERHNEWENQQHSKIHRKRELIDGAETTIGRIEDQIDHCRDLEADARSEDYASMVRGWIEEKYEVIANKRRFIADLEEQIREIEHKLH